MLFETSNESSSLKMSYWPCSQQILQLSGVSITLLEQNCANVYILFVFFLILLASELALGGETCKTFFKIGNYFHKIFTKIFEI